MKRLNKSPMGVNADNRQDVAGAKRQTGWIEEKVVFKDLNELMFELRCDHIIGPSSDVTNNLATVYYNSANTEFRDKNETPVTFSNGDTIAWRGLDSITSNIDISTIDDLEHVMFQGVTIALGIYDLDLGENQRGELDLTGTGTLTVQSSDGLRIKTGGSLSVVAISGDSVINNAVSAKVEFETSKDLEMNYTSNTTGQATFSRMSLLDSNYVPKFLNNKTLTWTMPGDLEPGTGERPSTTYAAWVDSDENTVLAPDILGTCDSTVSGFLVDSTATLLTDLIHAGDILYNLTTKEKTTASADAAVQDRVATTANIFSTGDQYKIVKMSPVGIGEWGERLGDFYNNSGSNFEDQHYAQIQEEKFYSEADGDFVLSGGAGHVTVFAEASVYQVNDWSGTGQWKIKLSYNASQTASADHSKAITGVVFKQKETVIIWGSTVTTHRGVVTVGTSDIDVTFGSSASSSSVYLDVFCLKKPTFHN